VNVIIRYAVTEEIDAESGKRRSETIDVFIPVPSFLKEELPVMTSMSDVADPSVEHRAIGAWHGIGKSTP
jgi:hypothetical protein